MQARILNGVDEMMVIQSVRDDFQRLRVSANGRCTFHSAVICPGSASRARIVIFKPAARELVGDNARGRTRTRCAATILPFAVHAREYAAWLVLPAGAAVRQSLPASELSTRTPRPPPPYSPGRTPSPRTQTPRTSRLEPSRSTWRARFVRAWPPNRARTRSSGSSRRRERMPPR